MACGAGHQAGAASSGFFGDMILGDRSGRATPPLLAATHG